MRILVIGCGSIGRRHVRNLRELGVGEMMLYDVDRNRAETLAWALQATIAETLERAYDEQPGAALVCAPTSLHLELAREAMEHGCHLFIEKPIAHSMKGVNDFLAEVRFRERVLLVGYNFRFDPLVKMLREWLTEGRVGRVVNARFHFGSYLPWRHAGEDYREGYGARKNLGGGVILDAVHEIDLALWIFGSPETVYCAGGKYSDFEIDVEDVAEISMSYPDKVVSIHLDSVQRPAERWCEIMGTRGQIRADLFARTLRHFDGATREYNAFKADATIDETYKIEMEHFLDCLGGQSEPLINGETATRSLILAEEAMKSMKWNLPISLNAVAAGEWHR